MKSEEAYSILTLSVNRRDRGVVLTRSGSICVSFELGNRNAIPLTPEDIDRRDGMFREAFKFLPDAHMCTNRMCSSRKGTVRTLPAALSLTGPMRGISGDDCMSASYLTSCTLYFPGSKVLRRPTYPRPCPIRENLHKEDLARLDEFLEGVDNAVGIIRACVIRRQPRCQGRKCGTSRPDTPPCSTPRGAVVDIRMPTRNSAQERNGHAASPSGMRPFSLTAAWIPMCGTTPFLPPAPCCTIRCWSSLGCTCRTTTS